MSCRLARNARLTQKRNRGAADAGAKKGAQMEFLTVLGAGLGGCGPALSSASASSSSSNRKKRGWKMKGGGEKKRRGAERAEEREVFDP